MVWPVKEPNPGRAPKGIRPHLVVKLKRGWRYDSSRRAFVRVSGDGRTSPEGLPRRTRIVHMVPDLARADPSSLSQDQCELAHYVQVIPPKHIDASKYLPVVRRWACVEEAWLSPEISLPH